MPTPEETAAAEAANQQKLADLVNGAVKAHLGRSLPKALEDAFKPHLATFEERLATLKPKESEPPKPKEGAGGPAVDPALQARLDELEKQVKKEQTARTKLTEERALERKQAREEAGFGALRTALTGKVRPEAVEIVAKLLRADGRLVVGEAGEVALKVGDLEHELAAGVEAYLKSTEAAMFLPAPGYGPTKGLRPGQKPPARGPGGGPPPKETPIQRTQRLLAQAETATKT